MFDIWFYVWHDFYVICGGFFDNGFFLRIDRFFFSFDWLNLDVYSVDLVRFGLLFDVDGVVFALDGWFFGVLAVVVGYVRGLVFVPGLHQDLADVAGYFNGDFVHFGRYCGYAGHVVVYFCVGDDRDDHGFVEDDLFFVVEDLYPRGLVFHRDGYDLYVFCDLLLDFLFDVYHFARFVYVFRLYVNDDGVTVDDVFVFDVD